MKGVVFTEFIGMVEEAYSPALADEIVMAADVPSGGAYTRVGTYPFDEMTALVAALSERLDIPAPDLLRTFGVYLFGRYTQLYPEMFVRHTSTLGFAATLDSTHYVEVRKLYPDAEVPNFSIVDSGPDYIRVGYRSPRHLEDVAEGLFQGAADFFGDEITIDREPMADGGVIFTLTRLGR